jgi:hypothetical protein
MHNGSGGQRHLIFTSFTDVDVFGTDPIGIAPTFFTNKSIGPFGLSQILITGFGVAETPVKFDF